MIRFLICLGVTTLATIICLGVIFISMARAECTTVDTVKSQINNDFPKIGIKDFSITEIGGDDARAFLSTFNAFPPKSNFVGDYVITVRDKTHINVVVIIFSNGCFSTMLIIGKANFENFLNSL